MRFIFFADRNLKEIIRDPVSISLGVFMPAVLLVLFISIGKKAPLEIFTVTSLTPGLIVLSFTFLTMFAAMLLAKDRQSAFLSRLLTAPLRPVDFILAYSVPFMPVAFIQAAVCFAVGVLFGMSLNMGVLLSLVVLVPTAIACIGIGMVIGSLCTENQVAGIGSIFITAASLFGGAWMDLELVGGIFKFLGNILPFSHAINATRAIINGSSVPSIAGDLLWVVGYAVCFFVLGNIAFRWKTKR